MGTTRAHRKFLLIGLALNGGFVVVEAVAAVATGSLVLLADAGHMLADVAAISFALLAVWFGQRPATAAKTFGYYRLEIFAALLNGVMLLGISAFIFVEAASRFRNPPEVPGVPLVVVATLGLVANLVPALLLRRGSNESLAVKSAFLDMLGDALASVGAIGAGVLLVTTGWRYADPVLAAGVAIWILPRTYKLMVEAVNVLLEGTPAAIDLNALSEAMLSVPGVLAMHDLHVWTVTSGFVALSGHLEVDATCDRDSALLALRNRLARDFDVQHVTLQVETADLETRLGQPCLPDAGACFAGAAATGNRLHDEGSVAFQ